MLGNLLQIFGIDNLILVYDVKSSIRKYSLLKNGHVIYYYKICTTGLYKLCIIKKIVVPNKINSLT